MCKSTKQHRWLQKICSTALLLVLVTACVQMFTLTTFAAEYEGKGTKSSPYLVTNAEQLDGMRNKLSAHYKLANTIDMSSVENFKPIGGLNKPFTGSFTCDTNSDGTPKYIIKNLKVSISPKGATLAEKYSGYKEDGSAGWEAALFGAAKGASFKNIVVLDANISSTVEGNSTMNGDWSINNGMDHQATAILVAIGEKVTIDSCGVSGTVQTKSNHGAGLVGQLKGGTVKNSYSYATVNAYGVWQTAGFVATVDSGAKVDSCFFDGVYDGGATTCGAFVGSNVSDTGKILGQITNCWAGGTVKSSHSGSFYGTDSFATHLTKAGITPADIVTNCYTTAKIEGFNGTPDGTKLTNNNWIAKEKGGFEPSFKAGTMEEINAAFASESAWTIVDGSYPQLKNVHPVKDASQYVPGAISESTQSEETEEADNVGGNATIDLKVDQTVTKMSMAERILIIVLLVVFFILMIIGVCTIVSAQKLLGTVAPPKQRTKKTKRTRAKKEAQIEISEISE